MTNAYTRTGFYPPVTYVLFDDAFIQETDGVRRIICPPQKLTEQVIKSEHPWEGQYVWMHNGLLYDPDEKLFKLWYHCEDPDFGAAHPELRWKERPAYAVSHDCIHWEKPLLNVVRWRGSKRNNLVNMPPYGGSGPLSTVLKNPHKPGYLAMGMARFRTPAGEKPMYWYDGTAYQFERKNRSDIAITCGFYVYDSRHGFTWRRRSQSLMSSTIVTDNMFAHGFDEELNRWIIWGGARTAGKFRTMGVSFSRDLNYVPFPQEILTPDGADPPECQFNHMVALKVAGGYAGLVVDFRPREGCKKEPQFIFSRDARIWNRTAGRKPFIPAGKVGCWDEMNVFVHNPVQVGDDIFIPYHGSITGNGSWYPQHKKGETKYVKVDFWGPPLPDGRPNIPGIGLAKLKRDRWAAMTPINGAGVLETKGMYWAGRELFVNADAKGGALRAELLDHRGQSIPGFTLRDSDPFKGESLHRKITWRGGKSLTGELIGTAQTQPTVGRLISIRFHLDRAKLYTFSC